jgi:hypothetical protein
VFLVEDNVATTDEHRLFRVRAYHDIIADIVKPLFDAAEDGVNLLCGDGNRRHCFPRFAQYIADYEEQRELAGILQLRCPKCMIPTYSKTNPDPDLEHHWRRQFEPRTMLQSMHLRGHLRDDPDILRQQYGYLPEITPFCEAPHEPQPGCTIFDALAPDTLHGVTKNFFDRVVQKWVKGAMEKQSSASKALIEAEIDQRLKQLPPFPGLRHFSKGMSHIDRWTGKEYKNLLRVYLGVIRGIAKPEVVRLVEAYLEIHRLSMYRSHTDNRDCAPGGDPGVDGTLQLLEKAIRNFWEILMDPELVWVKEGIVHPGWWAPKLHLMQHYPDEIRRKGTLPQCSTEYTEGFHRPIKKAYNASNRGASALAYIVRSDGTNIALRRFLDDILDNWAEVVSVTTGNQSTESESEGSEGLSGNGRVDEKWLQDLYKRFSSLRNGHVPRVWQQASRKLTGGMKKGYPKDLASAERDLNLRGFERATKEMLAYLHDGTVPNPRSRVPPRLEGLPRLRVNVYEQMRIVNARQGTDDEFEAHTVHCTDAYLYEQDPKKVAPRKDTVLVLHDSGEWEDQDKGTMAKRKVARVHCLFSLNIYPGRQFACVEYFECDEEVEAESKMFVVRKKDRVRYEVIPLKSIERGIHLIPDFGNEIGKTRRLRRGVKALDYYKAFVINNHIDLEAYKEIYGET